MTKRLQVLRRRRRARGDPGAGATAAPDDRGVGPRGAAQGARETVYPDAVRKLRAVREASAHAYPVVRDPDQLAGEIEQGYLDDGA